ncbi:class I SAM-dependent methyltransferase [Anaeromyxobacter oryzisoli]|uniref:class I SAM-dependent methyltransferase n=1 Tax=Anaeromyxobacter oryzisoli TaxID=2925408 RepID=UPI001F593A42|nr:class I SAM-dependent methyltransferase [Anaeromyxobacter sp. SG63]
MLLDPTDQFIRNIRSACDLDGKAVLEIGCGSGRITRDLAASAREVVAIDPDPVALDRARARVAGANVLFVCSSAADLGLAGRTFDVAIFSLSLHHVALEFMDASLLAAARAVSAGGRIIVIEPGDEGTLIEAETRFDVGDGDERRAKAAAQEALRRLKGWTVDETVRFCTLFHFQNAADFLENLPPRGGPPGDALRRFLEHHREDDRIVLWAERGMALLSRVLG